MCLDGISSQIERKNFKQMALRCPPVHKRGSPSGGNAYELPHCSLTVCHAAQQPCGGLSRPGSACALSSEVSARGTNEKILWEAVQPWWWTIAKFRKLHPASLQSGLPFMHASSSESLLSDVWLYHVCLSGHRFFRHFGNLTPQCHVVHRLRTRETKCASVM